MTVEPFLAFSLDPRAVRRLVSRCARGRLLCRPARHCTRRRQRGNGLARPHRRPSRFPGRWRHRRVRRRRGLGSCSHRCPTYFEVPSGAYWVRAVPAGSSDCVIALVDDIATGALKGGRFRDRRDGRRLRAVSERSRCQARVARRRLVRGARARRSPVRRGVAQCSIPQLEPRRLSGHPASRACSPEFHSASRANEAETDAGAVDPNGYLSIPPPSSSILTATIAKDRDAGGTVIVAEGPSIAAGSVATLAAVGGRAFDPSVPPQLLLCFDAAHAVGVIFADCRVLASSGD